MLEYFKASRHKISEFRNLYDDVHTLLQYCTWPAAQNEPILGNWSLDMHTAILQ